MGLQKFCCLEENSKYAAQRHENEKTYFGSGTYIS